ncbi:hypothetical protein ABTD35_20550, partial [Acinetobacter baumannii]
TASAAAGSHRSERHSDREGNRADPAQAAIRAQNLTLQEKDDLIRQLRQKLREREIVLGGGDPVGRKDPVTGKDLREHLNDKSRERSHVG